MCVCDEGYLHLCERWITTMSTQYTSTVRARVLQQCVTTVVGYTQWWIRSPGSFLHRHRVMIYMVGRIYIAQIFPMVFISTCLIKGGDRITVQLLKLVVNVVLRLFVDGFYILILEFDRDTTRIDPQHKIL